MGFHVSLGRVPSFLGIFTVRAVGRFIVRGSAYFA